MKALALVGFLLIIFNGWALKKYHQSHQMGLVFIFAGLIGVMITLIKKGGA